MFSSVTPTITGWRSLSLYRPGFRFPTDMIHAAACAHPWSRADLKCEVAAEYSPLGYGFHTHAFYEFMRWFKTGLHPSRSLPTGTYILPFRGKTQPCNCAPPERCLHTKLSGGFSDFSFWASVLVLEQAQLLSTRRPIVTLVLCWPEVQASLATGSAIPRQQTQVSLFLLDSNS